MITAGSTLMVLVCSTATPKIPDEQPDKRTIEIHEKALTVDTHCDTPMLMLNESFDIGNRNTPPQSLVDFPRMKEGGLDAMFFAAFTGQKERTAENTEAAYKMANDMIDAIYKATDKYSGMAEIATSATDASRIEKLRKRAIYIGMENGFPIGSDIGRVEEFYNRGVRYITLCHSKNNDICDSSTDNKDPDTNTMRYQKQKELQLVYDTKFDSMNDQEKEKLRGEWRNLNTDYPKALPTVADCVDHIDHVKILVGIDYVGIGSDFGGSVDGCADVSEFPNITAEMLKRGYTEEEIIKVWGGNFSGCLILPKHQ